MKRALTACAGVAGAALALAPPASAQDVGGASNTPGLRELTTDRPDTTESPFTVDIGHLQLETTLFGFSRSRRDANGVRMDAYEVGTTNLRIGVTSRLEADMVFQPYGRVNASHGSDDQEGTGDLTLRAKLNLWGANGVKGQGDTAFAVLPFVDIPTDRHDGVGDDAIGGGVILPLDVDLGGPFELGLNVGVNVRRDDPSRGYEAQVLLSASLGCDWNDRVGSYYEIAAVVNRGDPAGQMLNLNTGVTYKLRANLQLDVGVSVGVTRASDPVGAFVGVSARF